MQRTFVLSIFVVVILLCPSQLAGSSRPSSIFDQPEDHTATLERYGQKLGEILKVYYDAGRFQGAVLVAMDGTVIYRGAVGYANVEWKIPNTPDTRFTIASLGKAFTAAMILQLRDEGKIDLGAKLQDYLPSFKKDIASNVTIHQLLGHTAGIPWAPDEWEPEEFARRYTLDELVRFSAQGELLFEPGTEFKYCNSCYHLLAAVIERIMDNSFESELKRRLLDPLGMTSTGIAFATPLIEKRASGYERRDDGKLENAQLQDQSYALGAGGMYSTVDDLYKWDRALYSNEVLSQESTKLMFTGGLNGSGYGWAMGAYVEIGFDDVRELAVGYGGTPGYASGMARLLDDRHFIVFLGNVRQVPQNKLMNDLWNTILGVDIDPKSIAFD